jgi:DNA-binding IclR family transcriptional regulator
MGTSVLDYSSRPVAAFSISGPVQRMTDEKVEELSRHILDAKKAISQELGYFSK